MLFIAGDQIPVTPLLEVVGKSSKTTPEQIGATGLKTAVIGFTIMVKVEGVTVHCPTVGVKV